MPSSSRASGSAAAQTPRAPAPSPKSRLDEAVARLRDGAGKFASLPLNERISLLRAMCQHHVIMAMPFELQIKQTGSR